MNNSKQALNGLKRRFHANCAYREKSLAWILTCAKARFQDTADILKAAEQETPETEKARELLVLASKTMRKGSAVDAVWMVIEALSVARGQMPIEEAQKLVEEYKRGAEEHTQESEFSDETNQTQPPHLTLLRPGDMPIKMVRPELLQPS